MSQRNTSRVEAVQQARNDAAEIEARRRTLWYRLLTGQLSAEEGREFVNDVLLGDVGVLQPINLALPPNELAARVAQNNLGVRWLRSDVAVHRALYQQLQTEAVKRDEDRRKTREALAANQEPSE
jgi:hypothetical protein